MKVGFVLPALVVLALDLATKQFFWHLGRNFDLIDGILRITLVKNSGAAFGFFQGSRPVFILVSVIASALVIYLGLSVKREDRLKRASLGAILGGALGNLIYRIYPGEVVDFIDMGVGVHRWPVYNVADVAVTLGIIALVFSYLRGGKVTDGGTEETDLRGGTG